MGKANKNNDIFVLFEDMNGKFDFMLELMASMKDKVDTIPLMHLEISQLKSDVKVIKAAAIRTNQNVAGHVAELRELKTKLA